MALVGTVGIRLTRHDSPRCGPYDSGRMGDHGRILLVDLVGIVNNIATIIIMTTITLTSDNFSTRYTYGSIIRIIRCPTNDRTTGMDQNMRMEQALLFGYRRVGVEDGWHVSL